MKKPPTIESVAEEDRRFVMKAAGYITEYVLPRERPLTIIKWKSKPGVLLVMFPFKDEDLEFYKNNPCFRPYLDYLSARQSKSKDASMKRFRAIIGDPTAT